MSLRRQGIGESLGMSYAFPRQTLCRHCTSKTCPGTSREALRKRAKSQHRLIAVEVLALLQRNFPTAQELKRRREFVDKLNRLDASIPPLSGDSPSSDEMIREDRSR